MDTLRDQLQLTLGDGFRIERELGGGGMSRVFLATESAFGRPVVVKVLRDEISATVSADRFAREVRLAASLQHPNIVSVLAAGTSDSGGVPYYTMPFVAGDTLRARIQRGAVPIDEATSILRDVARALGFAHDRGIVHRDIKPENVLLSGDAALVTDFGIAKAVSLATGTLGGASTTSVLTEFGVALGTPAYMSPEQSTGEAVGPSTDVYAWGLVAYELLAGAHPFAGAQNAAKFVAAHLGEKPAPLSSRNPRVPAQIAALVMQCLEKDPSRRPATAGDVARALSDTTAARNAAAALAGRRTPLMVAAVVVAGVGLAAALMWRGNTASGGGSTTNSIAVLPFGVVGGDSSNVYFAEGIASDLTGALTKVPTLSVASQTSAFAIRKRPDLDVRQIGRALDVGAVVEGTVRRAQNRWRVTASLIRTTDGRSLWSQTYERDANDIFAVQDEITRAIVTALTARLSSTNPSTAATNGDAIARAIGTTDAEAYDLFLRGRYLLERRGAGVVRAADYFSQAIALDSSFARAYAALGEALALYVYFTTTPAAAVEPRLAEATRHALALDSTLANAHMARGMMHAHAFRWTEAGDAFRRSVALDSTSATVRTQYGRYLMYMGKFAEALVEFRAAERLDPAAGTPAVWVAHMLAELGQHDAAAAQAKRAWELDSLLATSQSFLSVDRIAAGRPAEALAILEHGGRRLPVPFNGMAAYVFYRAGARAAADSITRSLQALPANAWMRHTGLAFAYIGSGDTTRAFVELEAASRAREVTPFWAAFAGSMFDSVRKSARFGAIVRSFGLDPVRN